MALVTWPNLKIRAIEWRLDRPATANTSGWTGHTTVVANPWHGKWKAHVEPAIIGDEANAYAARAWLAQMKGTVNTTLLPATIAAQGLADNAFNANTAAGVTTLVMAGLRSVTAGQLATFALPSGNYQLVMITVSTTNSQSLSFEPPLREAVPAGNTIILSQPVCQVALTASEQGWGVSRGRIIQLAPFDVEERF